MRYFVFHVYCTTKEPLSFHLIETVTMTERGWNLIRSKPGFANQEDQWVGTKQLGGNKR